MYKRDFEGLLNANKLPKTLFIYGECDFQNNYFAKKVLDIWTKNSSEERLLLYYDEYNFSTAKTQLSQSSLFGGDNVVHVKSDKVIPKKELDILIELCNKGDNNYFIYQYFGDSTKASTISKAFKKNFVRFFKLNQGEAIYHLEEKAKELNVNISRYTLQHLYLIHMENMSLCINEFEKFKIFDKKIDTSDVDKLVHGLGSAVLEKFIEDILDKKDIKSSFSTLVESGNADEMRVINAIWNYMSNLLLFYMYSKAYGKLDIKSILGYPLPPHIAQQRLQRSVRLKDAHKDILWHLAQTQLKLIRTKNLDKNTFLLSSLIKLQSYL